MKSLPLKNVQLIILCSVFLTLSVLAVGLRLIARRIKRTPLASNDILIVLALVFLSGLTGIVINAKSIVSVGVHDASIAAGLIVREYKTYLASEILWVSAMTCAKLSILHLYLTIFVSRTFYPWVYSAMALTCAWWASFLIEGLAVCKPLAYRWNKSIDGHCNDILAGYISSAAINVALDVAVIILPMPMLWRLQIRLSKKILITGIFALGIVVIVISCLRVQALTKLKIDDLQYNSFFTDLYSVLEPCLAVVSACLPIMHPLYVKITSYDILLSLQSTLFSRSRKDLARSYSDSNERGWRKQSSDAISKGNETKHFKRLYNTLYPLTDYTTEIAADGRMGSEEHIVRVTYDLDVDSVKSTADMPTAQDGAV